MTGGRSWTMIRILENCFARSRVTCPLPPPISQMTASWGTDFQGKTFLVFSILIHLVWANLPWASIDFPVTSPQPTMAWAKRYAILTLRLYIWQSPLTSATFEPAGCYKGVRSIVLNIVIIPYRLIEPKQRHAMSFLKRRVIWGRGGCRMWISERVSQICACLERLARPKSI